MLQACRGILLDTGIQMEADDDGPGKQVTIPAEADFLYVYSTADGLFVIIITWYLIYW